VAPDVFVVLGASSADRSIYRLWEEPKGADFVPRGELADGTQALASAVLGLELRLTERGLRFHDPETGQDLPNLAETDEARRRESQAQLPDGLMVPWSRHLVVGGVHLADGSDHGEGVETAHR